MTQRVIQKNLTHKLNLLNKNILYSFFSVDKKNKKGYINSKDNYKDESYFLKNNKELQNLLREFKILLAYTIGNQD